MKTVVEVTEHAFDRLRERSGINKKAAVRLSERAYEKGIKHNETKGNLYRYISSVTSNSNKGSIIRLYGDKIFIFNKSDKRNRVVLDDNGDRIISLVTVIQVPNRLIKTINSKMSKKKGSE